MKIGDRFRRTASRGSILPHYQVGYESSIAEVRREHGLYTIIDENGHEHFQQYIEIIRNPLAEIDDLRAEITALREILQKPTVGNLYHDTVTDERVRIIEIQSHNDTIVTAIEGKSWDRAERLGSVLRAEIAEGRYVRIPG